MEDAIKLFPPLISHDLSQRIGAKTAAAIFILPWTIACCEDTEQAGNELHNTKEEYRRPLWISDLHEFLMGCYFNDSNSLNFALQNGLIDNNVTELNVSSNIQSMKLYSSEHIIVNCLLDMHFFISKSCPQPASHSPLIKIGRDTQCFLISQRSVIDDFRKAFQLCKGDNKQHNLCKKTSLPASTANIMNFVDIIRFVESQEIYSTSVNNNASNDNRYNGSETKEKLKQYLRCFDLDTTAALLGIAYLETSMQGSQSIPRIITGANKDERWLLISLVAAHSNWYIVRVSSYSFMECIRRDPSNSDYILRSLEDSAKASIQLASLGIPVILLLDDVDDYLAEFEKEGRSESINRQNLIITRVLEIIEVVSMMAKQGRPILALLSSQNPSRIHANVKQVVSNQNIVIPVCSRSQKRNLSEVIISELVGLGVIIEVDSLSDMDIMTGSHSLECAHSFIRYIEKFTQNNHRDNQLDISMSLDWGGIVGQSHVKQCLEEIFLWPPRYQAWFQCLRIRSRVGVLLYGPPGTGKTLFPKTLARRAGLTFFSVRIEDVVRGYLGEGEKMLREVFDSAKKHAPSLVFMDEFQAIFTKRDRNSGGEDNDVSDVGKSLSSTLLTCMDMIQQWNNTLGSDHRVVVLAATNAPWAIDKAFLRSGRFDKAILVGPLELEARREFLRTIGLNAIKALQVQINGGNEVDELPNKMSLEMECQKDIESWLDQAMVWTKNASGADCALLQRRVLAQTKILTSSEPFVKSLKDCADITSRTAFVMSSLFDVYSSCLKSFQSTISEDDLELFENWKIMSTTNDALE